MSRLSPLVPATLVVAAALAAAACGRFPACDRAGPCPADKTLSYYEQQRCAEQDDDEGLRPCGLEYNKYLTCAHSAPACGHDRRTDVDAWKRKIAETCAAEAESYGACCRTLGAECAGARPDGGVRSVGVVSRTHER